MPKVLCESELCENLSEGVCQASEVSVDYDGICQTYEEKDLVDEPDEPADIDKDNSDED